MPAPTRTAIASIILLNCCGTILAADEIAIPFPKDGAWARYHVTTTEGSGAANETRTRKETVRFVGTAETAGRRSRWFEQEFGLGEGRRNVMKALITEEDLKSPWPLADRRRYWHRIGDEPIGEAETHGPEYAVFCLVFPGPYNTAKLLKEPKTVEYQRGRFEIKEGLSGRQEITFQTFGHEIAFAMDYTTWRHPEISVGLAAAKVSFRVHENSQLRETYTTEFVLEDFGTDARSSLPEQN